jgi:hypothetical protein
VFAGIPNRLEPLTFCRDEKVEGSTPGMFANSLDDDRRAAPEHLIERAEEPVGQPFPVACEGLPIAGASG